MSEDRRGNSGQAPPNTSSTSNTGALSQVVPVRIAGHEYKIRSSGDPAQLQQIAGYVDRAMKQVRERTGTVDTLDVAVLTCLNLGREVLSLRERGEEQSAGASVDALQLRSLIERVEAVVAVGSASLSATGLETGIETGPETGPQAGAEPAEEEVEVARTLELPSVEALRDRNGPAHSGADSGENQGLAESRVAAGGRRDRAS